MSRKALFNCTLLLTTVVFAGSVNGSAPTDPMAAQQQPLRLMHVGEALDRAGSLREIRVLVADTGIDLDHPDLQGRLFTLRQPVRAPDAGTFGGNPPLVPAGSHGWDMIGQANGCQPGAEQPDANPNDPAGCSGHGTLVAGLLGAARNNGVGGAGVAPNARFIGMRTCWDGDQCYDHITPPAVQWGIQRGARIVTFSWLSGRNPAMARVIRRHPKTLFVTIPSGNGGPYNADGDRPFPCSVDSANVLCVSTSSPQGGLACGAFGKRFTDLAVPTQNNITTQVGGGFVGTGCATSFASPTAAGVAAILFGMRPGVQASTVRKAMIRGTVRRSAWRNRSVSGGTLDAVRAVIAMKRLLSGGGGGASCAGAQPTKTGTAGPDVIRGTGGRDVIVARGGRDVVRGGNGRDLICGGAGNDVIFAGAGNDRVFGEGGNDRLVGEEADDLLDGGQGSDRLNGSAGFDTCRGGPARDSSINCQRNSQIP